MIVAAHQTMMGGKPLPYDTNGLVGYWDGIWNAGIGVHDSSATSWADLSGNGQTMALYSGSTYFDTNSAILPQNGYVYGLFTASGALASCDGTHMTLECCLQTSAYVQSDSGSAIFWTLPVVSSDGTAKYPCIAAISARFGANTIVLANRHKQYFASGALYTGTNGSFAMVTGADQTTPVAYNKGVASVVSGVNNNPTGATSITAGGIGYLSASVAGWNMNTQYKEMRYFTTHIHAIRIYSRERTAQEVAANYAIDQTRFNLA